MIDQILEHPSLREQPPVLVDIGASGKIHEDWAPLAPYSICVAFDADQREMQHVDGAASGFQKLVVYNRAVTEKAGASARFHLTHSPYCSSLLAPNDAALGHYSHADLFEVTQTVDLPTVTLETVLAELQLAKIDWFKVDSQGTDLRLFRSLGEDRIRRTLLADFEPGIMDAYRGEDHLHDVMAFMQARGFWMSDLAVHGPERLDRRLAATCFSADELAWLTYGHSALRSSPGWAIVSYFNAFTDAQLALRDYLLGCAIALVKQQTGFALELVARAETQFTDPLLADVKAHVLTVIRSRIAERRHPPRPKPRPWLYRVARRLVSR